MSSVPDGHPFHIMDLDLHARCESCLVPEYAGLALTPQASCPYCARLSHSEKQQRPDAFALILIPRTRLWTSWILPFFLTEELEPVNDPLGVHSGNTGLPLSSTTNLPTTGILLLELPEIIKTAATHKNLSVLPMQATTPSASAACTPCSRQLGVTQCVSSQPGRGCSRAGKSRGAVTLHSQRWRVSQSMAFLLGK